MSYRPRNLLPLIGGKCLRRAARRAPPGAPLQRRRRRNDLWHAADEALDGQIQIKRRPMKAFARADPPPASALTRRRTSKRRISIQRHRNLALVPKPNNE